MEVPPGFKPGASCIIMHCSPLAHHLGVAARAAISFPYGTPFYDVIGLRMFLSLPFVGFVGLGRVRVNKRKGDNSNLCTVMYY